MLLDRRIFLKSIGIIGGGTLVSCNTMAPTEKLAAYLTPPKEMIPGIAAYYATVCRACPAGCGILVKTREGRPIKLEGNPAHPVNRGKLCARGQSYVQELYSAVRVRKPLLGQGDKQAPVSWDAAMGEVANRLKTARSVGFLTGLTSAAFTGFLADLGALYGASDHVTLEPAVPSAAIEASRRLFGLNEMPRIDLSDADMVLSIGADFLDAFLSPVELTRQWAERHGAATGRKLQLDYAGPRRNLTAAAADRWFPLRSSDAAVFAGRVLKQVFEKRKSSLGADTQRIGALVASLSKAVPKEADVAVADACAARLLSARRPVVLTGGAEVTGVDVAVLHDAALLTNYMLGGLGTVLRFGEGYSLSRVNPEKRAVELIERSVKGEVDVLFVHGADPAYSLPIADAIAKGKFVVSLAHSMDDTTGQAHVVLPVHHPLESWGDFDVTQNIAGLMQPVRAPLYNTKHVGDVLMDLNRRAGKSLAHKGYKEDLVARWAAMLAPPPPPPPSELDAGVSDLPENEGAVLSGIAPLPMPTLQPPPPPQLLDEEWEQLLVQGGRFGKESVSTGLVSLAVSAKVSAMPKKSDGGLELVTVMSPLLYDGRGAVLDWLRETPDPMNQSAWDLPLEVSKDVALKVGISDGDLVSVSADGREIKVRALVRDDLAPNTGALPLGGGKALIRYGEETFSPVFLAGPSFDAVSGAQIRSGVPVSIKRISDGKITSVMGSPFSEGRLLALSVGLDDLKADRIPKITRHGEVLPGEVHFAAAESVPMPHEEKAGEKPRDNMHSLQEHAKHRWGLVIDLDKCTGCSSCVAACYAENNIPVVGREEIRRGRELSWIRIEKHILNTKKNPRVQFLPVMCQQCDNAPCETVCPVFAASHTADGLNAQIYNRCVGTRYCANNCPYKVRRFNYFDYKREKPANQQLNPDVTVRSRGVMEKCTFCIQRIRETQNRKKIEGAPLFDGDILPACVQTCPSGAITFGDFNQQDWEMSTLARDKRGYRLLDYQVNTRPGVVYLRKVLTEPDGGSEGGEA